MSAPSATDVLQLPGNTRDLTVELEVLGGEAVLTLRMPLSSGVEDAGLKRRLSADQLDELAAWASTAADAIRDAQ